MGVSAARGWDDPFDGDELAGRVCLVTGAARGIGATIAATLARHGGIVAVTDLNGEGALARAAAIVDAGGQATAFALDVTDTAAIEHVADAIEDRLGPLDVVVNNAGLAVIGPSVDVTDETWNLHVDVMLSGPFKLCRRAGRSMLPRGRGAIVNVSSIGGFGGWPQRTAYNTVKAGVRAMTELLAVEWAPTGVRVNGIAPAVTRTEIMTEVMERSGGAITLDDFEGRTPLGRVAEAQEMADAVLFLASDHAAYVTGQTLPVDGGWLASDGFTPPGGAAGG
jgi:NAD(P)-dependent dehydrogenase (short-subunit alcohol dehydrogenase family)